MDKSKSLLIYAPVPIYRRDEVFYVEAQACNGLRLWASNFNCVTVMFQEEKGLPPTGWQPVSSLGKSVLARIRIVSLPSSYRPDQFILRYRRVREVIRYEISQATYLSFAIGGLFGDWGAVACLEAHKMCRPYAVWTDRVESEVTRLTSDSGSLTRRLRARLEHRPMAWVERFLIRRSSLGLFHGRETYDAFAEHCPQPHVVHNVHLNRSEHISSDALSTKLDSITTGPLKIAYVGRIDEMKGPRDWLEVLNQVRLTGVDFTAVWLGQGPLHKEVSVRVKDMQLEDRVTFPGFVKARTAVLDTLIDAHVFLFCHKTPESPRCLIESLACGTPIIGYRGAYAEDLIKVNSGGRLVPLHDTEGLAEEVVAIAKRRDRLGDLVKRAAKDGEPFDDESVFRHRSELIRKYL